MFKKLNSYIAVSSLFACMYGSHLHATEAPAQTILATPKGGSVFYNGKTVRTEELNTAIRKARAGDTVLILPGTYSKSLDISKQASPDKPIVVKGIDGLTIFNCNDLPASEGKAPIKLAGARGLTFTGLTFNDCWPSAFDISGSDHIAIVRNKFSAGKFPISVKYRDSHHILIEGNQWRQLTDNQALKVEAAKYEHDPTLRNYKGAFLHLEGIAGDLTMRRNKIDAAYAGVWLNHGKTSSEYTKNVRIYENSFANIKTSAIVLKAPVENTWIWANDISHTQNAIEVLAAQKGAFFVYANTFLEKVDTTRYFIESRNNSFLQEANVQIFNNTLACSDKLADGKTLKGNNANNGGPDCTDRLKPTPVTLTFSGQPAQSLRVRGLGANGLVTLPDFRSIQTPYENDSFPVGMTWDDHKVTLLLNQPKPLKGLSTLTLTANNSSMTSETCTQHSMRITCRFKSKIEQNTESWLEIGPETRLYNWPGDVSNLRIVRSKK